MNRKLYVGNLAFSTEESSIENMFAEAGPVQSVRLMRDRATGQSRGFAFVEMETEDGARAAIDKFNSSELDGRRLTVNEARPQTEGGGGGRGFGGGGGNRFGGGGGGGNRYGEGGGGGGRRREPRW
ncbi:MAG TPA: RNA-binding protein [Vicinamibacterales bacterium]|nr:RNA-binding protein [Vicinamibacterales bacterium]